MSRLNFSSIMSGHGSGGRMMHELINGLFLKYFTAGELAERGDSAIIGSNGLAIAFTTDSYVVDPLFFPGGNIGKLAVCGTVNDIAVSGAKPVYLSAGFILEEGFGKEELEKIVKSMAAEAAKADVKIVAGDTKVVPKGKGDKIYINTSGIGVFEGFSQPLKGLKPGDAIIINGTIGDHSMAVMCARKQLSFTTNLRSDCASLNGLISKVLGSGAGISFMRDATRGGLAAVLCESVLNKPFGINVDESLIPLKQETLGICEVLGFDPLHLANEGKVVMFVDQSDAGHVLELMRSDTFGKDAAIIGKVVNENPGMVVMNTTIGSKRIIDMPAGELLPRIC